MNLDYRTSILVCDREDILALVEVPEMGVHFWNGHYLSSVAILKQEYSVHVDSVSTKWHSTKGTFSFHRVLKHYAS